VLLCRRCRRFALNVAPMATPKAQRVSVRIERTRAIERRRRVTRETFYFRSQLGYGIVEVRIQGKRSRLASSVTHTPELEDSARTWIGIDNGRDVPRNTIDFRSQVGGASTRSSRHPFGFFVVLLVVEVRIQDNCIFRWQLN